MELKTVKDVSRYSKSVIDDYRKYQSHKEMAAARNISVVACRKRVQRAREILQKKIKE